MSVQLRCGKGRILQQLQTCPAICYFTHQRNRPGLVSADTYCGQQYMRPVAAELLALAQLLLW
jgi:hypothetical protein